MSDKRGLLSGSYYRRVDGVGRITLPRRFVEWLGERMVALPHFERSLALVRESDAGIFIERIWRVLASGDKVPESEEIKALLAGMPTRAVTADSRGRLTIPRPLREFAGISDEVVLLGMGDCVEIFDPSLFHRHEDEWIQETIMRLGSAD